MSTNTYAAGDSLFQIQDANRQIAHALAAAVARLFRRPASPVQARDYEFLNGPSFADQTPSMVREYISLGRYE